MKKSGRWLIALAVAAVVAVLFLAGPNGLIRLIQMKQREAYLEKRMVELKANIELTRQKIERMSTDPDFVRKIAKERLLMVDPADTAKRNNPEADSARIKPAGDSLSARATNE